jgi:hypothetical protein
MVKTADPTQMSDRVFEGIAFPRLPVFVPRRRPPTIDARVKTTPHHGGGRRTNQLSHNQDTFTMTD